jgi:hypothetical protein
MEYKDVLADFARRTLENLSLIRGLEQGQREAGVPLERLAVFPVTQQVNSLLGLVVFPKEGYSDHIPHKTLEQLVADGWLSPEITRPAPACSATHKALGQRVGCGDPLCPCVEHRLTSRELKRCHANHRECKTLAQLIRVLRNGVSHFNITFHPNPDTREISILEISNRCTCCNEITTTVRLSVEQAREIAERYARIIIEHATVRSLKRATPNHSEKDR